MTARGLIVLLSGLAIPLQAQAPRPLSPHDQRARDIFEQLININTTGSSGSTTAASKALADWLLKAGFPPADVQVIGLAGSPNHNLVARYRGTGASRLKPILLLAHLDVVEARREDWSLDPFTFTEQDGFFYGRGTLDVKDGAAILVATLARLKQEGYRPNRDLILTLTAGEEGGSDYNGVQWLLEHHRDLIDAEYVINMDGGDPVKVQGKRLMRSVQAAEKVYVTFMLEVRNPGGHSSLPTKDNAIYRLAGALGRVSAYEFPARLNEITRTFFQRMAPLQQGQLASDMAAVAATDSGATRRLSDLSPLWNAQLRTTCVATQLAGGHAENALPQTASATVNCRMLPGTPQDEVQRALTAAVNDTAVAITVVSAAVPSPPSPLKPEIMGPIERVTKRLWNIPVIPVMETGATDGLYFRNAGIPVYGVSGVFVDINDVRAHGKDERIGVQDYYDGAEYIYQLVKEFTSTRR